MRPTACLLIWYGCFAGGEASEPSLWGATLARAAEAEAARALVDGTRAASRPAVRGERAVERAAGRRLFSWPNFDVGSVYDQATQWAGQTAASVGDAVGLTQVANIFNESKVWVEEGLKVAQAGWQSMLILKDRMVQIFLAFAPLKPLFADKNGLVGLITNQTNMLQLVHVVEQLLGTSGALGDLSGALHNVSGMLVKIQELYHQLLSKIAGRRRLGEASADQRALSDSIQQYSDLLQGLSFDRIVSLFQGFVQKMGEYSGKLTMVNEVLGPLLKKLEGGLTGRRLSMESILEDQQRYAGAIKAVVPTWQGIEQQGIDMCPTVANAQGGIASLKCRVVDFAKKAVLPSWAESAVSSLVSGCPAPSATAAERSSCPTTSQSAGVTDLLGQNADMLGLILAVVGALGLLGVGGGVAAVRRGKAAGESDESSSEEGSEGSAAPLTHDDESE